MSRRSYYNSKEPRNRSPPSSSYSKRDVADRTKVRKILHVASAADHAELEQHYSFLPDNKKDSTWQDRMVQHYHSHLYKEYVLADLTRPGQVGMRWRTEAEVQRGKGHLTCGNKHCPSYQNGGDDQSTTETLRQYLASKEPTEEVEELKLLKDIPYGSGLHDYEVPFTYQEREENKTELVKLRLCLRCAPLLFRKHNVAEALKAREARYRLDHAGAAQTATKDDNSVRKRRGCSSSSDDSSEERRRGRKHKKKKRRRSGV
jgi:hypothetical protein